MVVSAGPRPVSATPRAVDGAQEAATTSATSPQSVKVERMRSPFLEKATLHPEGPRAKVSGRGAGPAPGSETAPGSEALGRASELETDARFDLARVGGAGDFAEVGRGQHPRGGAVMHVVERVRHVREHIDVRPGRRAAGGAAQEE